MPEQDQEKYLSETKLWPIVLRGIKKLITEITSIKTLALGAMVVLLFLQKIDAMWGVMGVLALTGAKEIDFNQVVQIIQMKFGRNNQ